MPRGFFITGTDTGVGKTFVASTLLRAFAGAGLRTVGMKPVAAGCDQNATGLHCEDVEQLMAAANVHAPMTLVCPYPLALPIAPHIAAAQANCNISLAMLHDSFLQLQRLADITIVEGVGGFCVPLNTTQDTADLAQLFDLPVIMVVGLRVGCLNHALLTAQAIRARGLTLAGWVANQVDPTMSFLDQNILALQERLNTPLLAVLSHTASPDPVKAAAAFNLAALSRQK